MSDSKGLIGDSGRELGMWMYFRVTKGFETEFVGKMEGLERDCSVVGIEGKGSTMS